jgi:hypothetical protein
MLRHAVASLSLVLLVGPAVAIAPPGPDGRPREYDARSARGSIVATAAALRAGATTTRDLIAAPTADPGELRLAAVRELELGLGDAIEVRWNAVTGSPSLLFARKGWLSPDDDRLAETIAREFLQRHAALFGLSPAEAGRLRLESSIPVSGGEVLHFQQEIEGLLVDHGHLSVVVSETGRVLSLAGGLVTGGRLDPRPRLDPAMALATMARVVGVADARPELLHRQDGRARFSLSGFSHGEVELELGVFPTGWGPRLAWGGRLDAASHDAAWEILVDDATGRLLSLLDLTRHADTRGRVFAENPDKSPHEIQRFADREDWRSELSLLGWADADQTAGNNVVAREDRDGDNETTPGVLATAAPAPPYLAFDFAHAGDPVLDLDSSITQLFFGVNFAHDRLLELGFDEASGNYQQVNVTGEGVGGDPVLADAQDAGAADNANFTPDREGRSGRMQMGVWGAAPNARDSAFDVGVVVHEFVHGVSMRLVGGPGNVGCLGLGQDGAMGEGWSDFIAASFFEDPVIGAWVSGNPAGIRMFALDDNPASGKDYRDYCTAAYQDPLGGCEVHANGEIWAGFLWKLREAYIAAHGSDGIARVERLVIDAMKLTPCSPSMLDARDALVLADRLSTGGQHECLIKTEAAGRWMGFSASSAGAGDQNPVAADNAWPECVATGLVRFTRLPPIGPGALAEYACEDVVEVSVVDGSAALPLQATLTTTGGDSEVLDLAAGTDPATFFASIAAGAGVVTPGDGALQVAQGESITVTYDDTDPIATVEDTARVTCRPRLQILSHRITNSSCDEDTVPGFPDLPGFLDAGESADLVLTVANPTPLAIDGVIQATTDRPDLVEILVVNARVSFPAAQGPEFPGVQAVTLRLAAAPDFMGATELSIDLALIAPGYDPGVGPSRLLRLDLDYLHETDLTIGDGAETEVGGPVGPAWSSDTLMPGGNEWTLVNCHASEGAQSYRNGPSDCTGDYTDDQGVPWLAFPQIDFGAAGAEAARITNLSFQHDVDLGGGPGQFGALGADAVALLATADPSALDLSNPLTLLADALGAYANLPDFGFDFNTSGFELQSIDVPPEALPNLDQRRPFYIAWLFYPEVIAEAIFGPNVGEGYYVDDVIVTYDRVVAVPSAAGCIVDATVVARPDFLEPASAVDFASTCAGEALHLDASFSDSVGCVPADLDYRFLDASGPVPCATDAAGMTPRLQDVDGWGETPDCWDFPTADTVYQVEVRCRVSPTATDLRTVELRVLDGLPLLATMPSGFCTSAPTPVALDASESALVGCPGERLYRFLDGAGAEMDCDGDGNPDGFVTDPTCELAASGLDETVTLELGCDALPGCVLSDSIVVPALDIQPDAAEVAGPGTVNCVGTPFAVTGAGTMATGCSGALEYRWTDGAGWDTGFTTDPLAMTSLDADGTLTLEVRCDSVPDCVATTTLDVDLRDGAISLSSNADPGECADAPMTLQANEDTPVQCGGALEYRFLVDPDGSGFVLLDCDGDGMPDDWSASAACDTAQVAFGANFVAEVRCDEDAACSIGAAPLNITPWDGVPTGDPQGTLMGSRAGSCPAGPIDVTFDWSDSGRTPQAFVMFRSEDPASFPDSFDVDGTSWTDAGLSCADPARTLYRGVDVLFYTVLDRNVCTGAPIDP